MKQVQCCGKVLLSGGYSIIYPHNNGISLAVNAKFHTTFKESEEKSLIIRSHQFNSEYTYNENQIHNHKIFDSIIKTLTQYDKFKSGIIEVKNDPQFFGFQSKSGLGSSACLIVSMLGLFEQDLKQLFEMSTFANNLSQNKIGSGFDISTAIFGSQLFSRRSIRLIQNDKFKILLIDLNQGQDSVTSAKVVKSYLDENSQVREKFFEISEKASDSLLRFIEGQYSDLKYLKSINIDYRQALKNLGHQCLLDIEPDQSTQILNQLMAEKNIIWALVPGAGGKDAIAALVDKSFNEKNVELIKQKLKLDNIYLLELGESIKLQ